MRIFWANWKLVLLQIRASWAVAIWAGVLYLALLTLAVDEIVVSAAFIGLCVSVAHPFSAIHRNLVPKPFFFCLPGNRNALRAMILTDAVVGGLVYAVGFAMTFRGDEWSWPSAGWYAFIGFLLGLATALRGPGKHFRGMVMARGLQAFPAFLGLTCAVIGLVAAIFYPWLTWPVGTLICAAACVFSWRGLSDEHDLSRAHRTTIEDAMLRRARACVKSPIPSWTGQPLLAWARRCRPLGFHRYMWASLYRALAPLVACWKWALVGMLVLSLVLTEVGAELGFGILGLMAVLVDLPVTSKMLLPGGRRERYWATVAAVFAASLLFLALAGATVGLSELIVIVLGRGARSPGYRFSSVGLASTLVPWICALKLRGFPVRMDNEMTVLVFVGAGVVVALHWLLGEVSGAAIFLAAIGLCGWIFFLLTLKYICAGGCLMASSPRPGYAVGV